MLALHFRSGFIRIHSFFYVRLARIHEADCSTVQASGYDVPITLSQRFDRDIMSLRIIATGGTFDKHYFPLDGSLGFGASVLPEALARARLTEPCEFQSLMAIDSLDMQDHHRQQILAACKSAPESRIVIVHGTDTMCDTAAVLASAALGKTIVLTGAMVPYAIAGSDAMFNLGSAITAASLSAPGVWIVMHAQVFAWNAVRKNRAAGIFERSD